MKKHKKTLKIILATLTLCACALAAYANWSPGTLITDGRHDRGENAIWLSRGWLGHDSWFERTGNDPERFRNPAALAKLRKELVAGHVTDIYPRLRPSSPGGGISPRDPAQTERFLDAMEGFRVLPWVGGKRDIHCFLESSSWRNNFTRSIALLFDEHPRLAGIHLNIEPLPSGDESFLGLLDEVRDVLPLGKVLSVAAYPPPSLLQPVLDVHWQKGYFGTVSRKADQMAVMMYDTALPLKKPYVHLVESWTRKVLEWGGSADILLGLPVYEDHGVLYHHPHVENLENALAGIHAGLRSLGPLPAGYQGVALYCNWEMDAGERDFFKENFLYKEKSLEASL